MRYYKDLTAALSIASDAGEYMREQYEKMHDVRAKNEEDFVTSVDIELHTMITRALHQAYPNTDILSEETSEEVYDYGQRLWVVDPLDGTTSYINHAGKDYPSIMLALREDMETRLAVIHLPLTGEYYFASEDEDGVKKLKSLQQSTPETLTVPQQDIPLEHAWVDLNRYADGKYTTKGFTQIRHALEYVQIPRTLTSLVPHSGMVTKMMDPTKPNIHAVIHDNSADMVKHSPWDIIPAEYLLRKAGGGMWINQLKGNDQLKRIDPFEPRLMIATVSERLAVEIIQATR